MTDYDVIIIGAGHNGLTTAKVLADRGIKAINLEKNDFVGGIAGTREVFSGCRNDIGATYLFPIVDQIYQEMEFDKYGLEFINMPIASVNLLGPDDAPLVMHSDTMKMAEHVFTDFGEEAAMGFFNLSEYTQYPTQVMDRFSLRTQPKTIGEIFASAETEQQREQLKTMFFGNAMEIVDRFFPDHEKHRTIRAMLAFLAVQSTYKGPYSAGSAFCLLYSMANNSDSDGLMKRVKGGMGSLSETLQRAVEDKGGEVSLKTPVESILIENNKAIGVKLKDGREITAKRVISNLDKYSTFFKFVGEDKLPSEFCDKIRRITSKGAYMHVLWKFKDLPEFGGKFKHLNEDINNRVGCSMFADPEVLQQQWEDCRFGRIPSDPATSVQIPSIVDPSMAPAGYHVGNSYIFYYPCTADKKERGQLKDQLFDRVVEKISGYMPEFRDCVDQRAIFASDHFTTMSGTAHGDFCHGLMHPDEMFEFRTMVPGSAHATPIENLYICGSSTHPGPGVTFIPGYNCGHEVADELQGIKEDSDLRQAS